MPFALGVGRGERGQLFEGSEGTTDDH
jgi:hypothetical protein